ncbi:MAG: helix-turn-helix domain-containing protein [Bacteroidia bacterium]|jgi:y4mF family transcriptional regulator
MKEISNIAAFVKYNRDKHKLTQEELAETTGVGIHFIRDLEQGRSKLRLDKVNQVLSFFGFHLGPNVKANDPWLIWYNFLGKAVTITKTNKQQVVGFLMKEVRDEKSNIVAWKVLPNSKALSWKKKEEDSLLVEIKQDEIADINYQTL